MSRIICGVLTLMASLLCTPAFAQDLRESCTRTGRPIREVGVHQSYNDFRNGSNSVTSLGASIRFCRRDGQLQLHVEGGFDRVDTLGPTTTAGRIGVGVYHLVTPQSASSTLVVGLTGRVGYEDFDFVTFDASGNRLPLRGSRLTKSVSARAEYVFRDSPEAAGAPSHLDFIRIGAGATYLDKRSPGSGVPDFLTESFAVGEADATLGYFADHHSHGSIVEVQARYEHFFTNHLAVDGIATLGLRWRPQRNPSFDNPDLFVLGLAYRFGNNGFSGWVLSLSKAF